MRKASDSLSSRNQELVKVNTSLRHRLGEMEKEREEMKTKMASQKHKLEYLHKAKKQLEDNLNKMKVKFYTLFVMVVFQSVFCVGFFLSMCLSVLKTYKQLSRFETDFDFASIY